MNTTDKIFEWIDVLEKKPRMVFTDEYDFNSLKIYVEGYIHGLEHAMNINLTENITLWFKKKVGQKSALFWTTHISVYNQGMTEDELKSELLSTLREYFIENPNWVDG